jgi:tetratricopeptide (TPR) repeat protein
VAEDLFNKGIQLLEQEKYDRACPYLEESYRRDPLLGALIALADCEYERGRLATALKRYQEYVDRHENLADVAQKKQGSRVKEAKAKVDELTSAVPTIKITIPPEAKIPILHMDGIRVKPDEAYPVDPGKYQVTLDVFGRETAKIIVEARKGQKKIVPMDLGKPIPIQKQNPDGGRTGGDSRTEPTYDGLWKAGIVLMSLGLASYITVYFTAGPIGDSAVPGSLISIGLGGTLTLGGAVMTIPATSPSMALRKVSVLPLVHVGQTPERPTIFGVQGRF